MLYNAAAAAASCSTRHGVAVFGAAHLCREEGVPAQDPAWARATFKTPFFQARHALPSPLAKAGRVSVYKSRWYWYCLRDSLHQVAEMMPRAAIVAVRPM